MPSCRGRKGDVAVKTGGGKPPGPKPKDAKEKAPSIAAPTKETAAAGPKKGKSAAAKKGPPPAAAAFLAKKRAEAEAEAAAAAAAAAGETIEGGGNSSESETEAAEQVALSLDTFNPEPEDEAGMLACVTDMPIGVEGGEECAAGLVRLILKQSGECGFVVKIANDEDVYGLMSVLNMNQASAVPSLGQVGAFIAARSPDSDKHLWAEAVAGSTGLVISERALGTPVDLAVPLLISLLDEIKEAQTGQYKKLREKYKFDSYLLLTRALRKAARTEEDEDALAAGAAGAGAGNSEGAVSWLKVEEEAFARCAAAEFEFDLASQPAELGAQVGKAFGKALLVKADQIEAVRQAALDMVEAAAQQ